MDPQVAELNQKIDALTTQVAYLAEQARIAERSRLEREELISDLLPVAHEAMTLATRELEEVKEYLDLSELVRLLKKVVRQRPQLEMALDTLDSVTDMLDTSRPVVMEGFARVTTVMEELERKGYFTFARGGLRLADNVVTSFSEEDVNRLGDNIVLILNVVKDLTQPEIMTFVRNTIDAAEQEVTQPVNTSLGSILRQMQDPAVRRGLALTLRILRVVGIQAAAAESK